MKKILNLLIVILTISLFFTSCEKPQEIYDCPIPEEGVYITGSGIYTDSMQLKALMDEGKVLNSDDEVVRRDSLYQKFLYVEGGNFSVKQQIGDVAVNYGLSGAWTEEETGVWSADVIDEGDNFTAPEDGFYLFVIDLNMSKAFLFDVNQWYIEGDAIETSDAKMTLTNADKQTATWYGSGIEVKTGDFNFKFYSNNTYSLDGDTVNLVTYLGSSLTIPEFGGDDFNVTVDQDTFSFTLNYDFVEQFTANNTMPPYDPREHTYSLIGDAFYQDNNPDNSATAWDVDFLLDFDAAISDTTNQIYKFTYNGLYFIGGKEFKIRVDQAWNGLEMGYEQVDNITGDAANITNAGGDYGNFEVINDAQYDVTFTYDVANSEKSIDFTPSKK